MRTLKLRFPDDALPTLDTFLKHTKDACLLLCQAVRNVVKGQRLHTSPTRSSLPILLCASGSIVLRIRVRRVSSTAHAPGAPPKSHAS